MLDCMNEFGMDGNFEDNNSHAKTLKKRPMMDTAFGPWKQQAYIPIHLYSIRQMVEETPSRNRKYTKKQIDQQKSDDPMANNSPYHKSSLNQYCHSPAKSLLSRRKISQHEDINTRNLPSLCHSRRHRTELSESIQKKLETERGKKPLVFKQFNFLKNRKQSQKDKSLTRQRSTVRLTPINLSQSSLLRSSGNQKLNIIQVANKIGRY